MNFEALLADRTGNMKASAIRETLKVIAQPGMISLAGGIPAPESFPMDIMHQLIDQVLDKYSWRALQYGPTEGFPPLRQALGEYVKTRGVSASAEDVIITTGSQGSLDALGKIMITKGDKIVVEAPTYLGALSAFNPYEPEYLSVRTDADGVIPEALDEILSRHRVKFVYLIPTFQNPSGRTIPLARRQEIARIIVHHGALLLEDDPYSRLRYRGDDLPTIKSLAPDHVVYMSTMSKVLAPGLRIGYCVAPPDIRNWMVLAKQGIDLQSSSFDQALAAEYVSTGCLEKQIPKIVALYRPKQEAMLAALDKYFPESFTWSRPDGGMFLWAEGPKGLDADRLYYKAVERKVAYVPGRYFYADGESGRAAMRLNFTMSTVEELDRAIKILADLFAAELSERHRVESLKAARGH